MYIYTTIWKHLCIYTHPHSRVHVKLHTKLSDICEVLTFFWQVPYFSMHDHVHMQVHANRRTRFEGVGADPVQWRNEAHMRFVRVGTNLM